MACSATDRPCQSDSALKAFLALRDAEQTCPVVADSIVTAVCCRNRNRNHFPLNAAELSRSVQSGVVDIQMRLQNFGRQAVDLENIGHCSGPLAQFVISPRQFALGVGLINGLYPSHAATPATS